MQIALHNYVEGVMGHQKRIQNTTGSMIRNNARRNHHETRCSKLFKTLEAASA